MDAAALTNIEELRRRISELESKLRRAESRAQSIAENLPGSAVFVVDHELRYVHAGGEALALAGHSSQDFIGRRVDSVLPPELADDYCALYRRALAGETFSHEHEVNGRVYLSRGTPLRDEGGRVTAALAVSWDITDSRNVGRELEESRTFLDSLTGVAPILLYLYDLEQTRTVWINEALPSFLGYEAAEISAMGGNVLVTLLHPRDLDRYAAHYERLRHLQPGETAQFEYRMRHKNGSWRWLVSRERAFRRDAEGAVTQVAGAAQDITERRDIEDALARQLRLTRAITDNATTALFIMDERQHCVFMNPAAVELTGYTLEEVRGRTLHEVVHHTHPDGRPYPIEECPVDRAFPENMQQSGEEIFVHKDGSFYPVAFTASPMRTDGRITGTVIEVRDIRSDKAAEAALRASEARYRSLFDSIDEGFCIIEVLVDARGEATDYRFLEANPAFEKQSGLVAAAGRRIRELVPDHDAHWFSFYGEVARTGVPARIESYAEAMGRWFDVYAFRTGSPRQRRVAVLFNDISARKRRESNLAFIAEITETLSRLHTPAEIMEAAGERVGRRFKLATCNFVDIDQARDEFTVAHAWRRDPGPEFPRTWRLSEMISSEQYAAGEERRAIAVADTQSDPRIDSDSYVRLGIRSFVGIPFHSNGRWTHQLGVTDTRPRAWKEDEIQLLREVATQVFPRVERARAEEARDRSEQRLQQVFRQAPVAIIVFRGPDFVVELANPVYEALLPGRLLQGRRFFDVMPELREEVWAVFHRVVETGEPFVANDWHIPYDSDCDGVLEDHWFNVVYHPLREDDNSISGFVAVLTDVTEQVVARHEMERVNRELEEFAYVASHDLQEPLRMVNIFTQLILSKVGPGDAQMDEWAEYVRKGVTRMEALIRDLLTYSRTTQRNEVQVGTGDLQAAFNEALSVLKGRIDESAAIIECAPLPLVRGETAQLAHVFQNLLTNALKYRRAGETPHIRISAEHRGDMRLICFADNGIGFEQKYAERIFGLFKRLHKDAYPGTGLGLAICRRIVERFGGRIWAEGRSGEGATFYFELPGA